MKGSAVRVRASAPRKALETGPFSVVTALCDRLPPAVVRALRRKGASSTSDSPGATTISMTEILQNGWTRAGCRRESKRSGSSLDPSSFMAPRSRQIASEIERSEDYAGSLVHELREGLAEHVLEV